MIQMGGEGEPAQIQPVDLHAAAAEHRGILAHGLGDHVRGVDKAIFPGFPHPAEPLVGAGCPQVVALLHVGPPPVQHGRRDPRQKVLVLGVEHPPLGSGRLVQLQPRQRRLGAVQRCVGQGIDVCVIQEGQIGLPAVCQIFQRAVLLFRMYFRKLYSPRSTTASVPSRVAWPIWRARRASPTT